MRILEIDFSKWINLFKVNILHFFERSLIKVGSMWRRWNYFEKRKKGIIFLNLGGILIKNCFIYYHKNKKVNTCAAVLVIRVFEYTVRLVYNDHPCTSCKSCELRSVADVDMWSFFSDPLYNNNKNSK